MIEGKGSSAKRNVSMLALAVILILSGADAFSADAEKPAAPKEQSAEGAAQDMIDMKVPLFSERFASIPLAIVNDDPITLGDFKESIGMMHTDMKEGRAAGKKDYAALLNRLITVKLILQEAGNIGLDELPEVKQSIDAYSRIALLELFQKKKIENLKPDENEVDKIYKAIVREYGMLSVLFQNETAARNAEAQIKGGANLDEVLSKALKDGAAKGEKEVRYYKSAELLPQVAKALSGMKSGDLGPVIQVGTGFAVFKLEDIRYPENPQAREQARQEVIKAERVKVMEAYNKQLAKKYVKLKKAVFDSVNYEKGNLEKWGRDKRAVAEIKGDKPLTVAELTEALAKRFYHGVESAKSQKKMNEKKIEVLQELFAKRIFRLEAIRLGIDKSGEYKTMIKEYGNSVLFGTFVDRVIVPDIKLSNDELKAYYDKHTAEFSFPEMIRIRALPFGKMEDAANALEKLRKGTDFQWLSGNAEGRIDKGDAELLNLEKNLLVVTDLPVDISKAVEGAKPDDARIYSGKDGNFYVLYIQELVPAKPEQFVDVRERIAGIIYKEKLGKAVEDWADKLRKASDVKVYATGFSKN